jgi:hypothetical protein
MCAKPPQGKCTFTFLSFCLKRRKMMGKRKGFFDEVGEGLGAALARALLGGLFGRARQERDVFTEYDFSKEPEFKCYTKDGCPVYHLTFTEDGRHLSYDVVDINGKWHYIEGSGHEKDHETLSYNRPDGSKIFTWKNAHEYNSWEIIGE